MHQKCVQVFVKTLAAEVGKTFQCIGSLKAENFIGGHQNEASLLVIVGPTLKLANIGLCTIG